MDTLDGEAPTQKKTTTTASRREGDSVEGVAKASAQKRQQIFAFLSRRSRNQIEPGAIGGDNHHSETTSQNNNISQRRPVMVGEQEEIPHVGDLFRCASTGQIATSSVSTLIPDDTGQQSQPFSCSSLKRSFLQPRGPFALCCTADNNRATTPTPAPVTVRYDNHQSSRGNKSGQTNHHSNRKDGKSNNHRHPHQQRHSQCNYKDNLAYESNEIERRFYSPPPPPPVAEMGENGVALERPRSRKIQVGTCGETDAEAMDQLQELKSSANYSPSTFDRRPQYAEYYRQNTYNSIAMSACRSRLREKLLPPQQSQTASVNRGKEGSSGGGGAEIYTVQGEAEGEEEGSTGQGTVVANNYNNHVNTSRPSTGGNSDSGQGNSSLRPASADSLARQALMAAQVLHLIPTEKARARSVAQGTSILNNTLLGTSELNRILPNREVKIFVGTWNMNGEPPPAQMADFVFPLGIDHVPDIIVIGTQEACSERFEFEVGLQQTLGPSHILFHSAALGTLHLVVYIRRDLVWFCSLPEDDSFSVRPGTAFRTKGAVAISFYLFGTSFLFVTSHLTAHQAKVKERVQDIRRIINSLDLPRNHVTRQKSRDVTQNFDCVYWSGDLNFRLAEPREKLLQWIETTHFPLPAHLPHGYMHTDQLKNVLADGAAFKGFKEANILFPPTYKYDVGTHQFDTSSKQRAPAYTDRILYKYRTSSSVLRRGSMLISGGTPPPHPIECLAYDSVPSILTSDHKPVWALFRNYIRPGVDNMPLAAGLFNRDVYLEAMKRRMNEDKDSSSAVCAIQ